MKARNLHPWDVSVAEAIAIQRRLAAMVERADRLPPVIRLVAGVDLSPPDTDGVVTGAVVVVKLPALELVEVRVATGKPGMPYVPGLLSFREAPVLVAALEALASVPDVVMVDGQGIAHPRRLGIAAHLGVLLDVPTVGVAKSVLCGRHETPPLEAGSWTPLVHTGEVVGAALRTRTGVSPVYVSIGHKVDLPRGIEVALACRGRVRVPEPTRLAHEAAAGRLPPGARPSHDPPDAGA